MQLNTSNSERGDHLTAREIILDVRDLSKVFDNGKGCRNISLQVKEGEAFGFLGPNGAGKSTFVKMLVGLIRPTEGNGLICGHPIGSLEARREIGYLPELFRYQEWLSGQEVMELHAKLTGMEKSRAKRRIAELMDEVGIGKRAKDRVKHYSKGMQQRLGLACAVLNEPKIVFLDEPASALDPLGRVEVRQLLGRLRNQGTTIFLNSHLLEDVEMLCERVALLNDGTMLAEGSVEDVLQEKASWHIRVGGLTPLDLDWLRETMGVQIHPISDKPIQSDGSIWLEVSLSDGEQAGWLNSLLLEQGLTLYESKRVKSRLDEWFIGAVAGLSARGERD